jgi:hypothetical protein
MAVMRYKRFTKVSVLKGIGRQLLGRFFSRVNGQSNGQKLIRGLVPLAEGLRGQRRLCCLKKAIIFSGASLG